MVRGRRDGGGVGGHAGGRRAGRHGGGLRLGRGAEAERGRGGFPVLVAGGSTQPTSPPPPGLQRGAHHGHRRSSGLESSLGVKDRAAIATFVKGALKSRD